MPETTIKVANVLDKKSKKNKPYWLIKDGNDDAFFAWEKGMADTARQAKDNDAALVIEYEEDNGYKTAKTVRGPVKSDEPPPLGTGDYVRAQTAPNDKKSITASVALKAAVDTLSHTVKTDATPRQAADQIQPLADAFYLWLCKKSGLDATASDDDIPF